MQNLYIVPYIFMSKFKIIIFVGQLAVTNGWTKRSIKFYFPVALVTRGPK